MRALPATRAFPATRSLGTGGSSCRWGADARTGRGRGAGNGDCRQPGASSRRSTRATGAQRELAAFTRGASRLRALREIVIPRSCTYATLPRREERHVSDHAARVCEPSRRSGRVRKGRAGSREEPRAQAVLLSVEELSLLKRRTRTTS